MSAAPPSGFTATTAATAGMGYTNNAYYAKNAATWTLHPRFDPRRQEYHYSFALAPVRWQGQLEECLRYTRALIATYTQYFDLHPHYSNDTVLKWWDLWVMAPLPEELLTQIRNLEGTLYIFQSHPIQVTVNIGPAWTPRTPQQSLPELQPGLSYSLPQQNST